MYIINLTLKINQYDWFDVSIFGGVPSSYKRCQRPCHGILHGIIKTTSVGIHPGDLPLCYHKKNNFYFKIWIKNISQRKCWKVIKWKQKNEKTIWFSSPSIPNDSWRTPEVKFILSIVYTVWTCRLYRNSIKEKLSIILEICWWIRN